MESIVGVLSRYIQGSDWWSLTAVCRAFRMYACLNPRFHVVMKMVTRAHLLALPPGVTGVNIGKWNPPDKRMVSIMPRCVKTLTLSGNTRARLNMPEGLENLILNKGFSGTLQDWILPDSLKTVLFHKQAYVHPVESWPLPKFLVKLTLDGKCDRPVESWSLPDTLRYLVIDGDFNRPVEKWKLPDGLLHLFIGGCFNRPVESWVLPSKLEFLKIGGNFNKPVQKWKLPDGLQTLIIDGWGFNQAIMMQDGFWSLSRTLRTLHLLGRFNQSVNGFPFPENLEDLAFSAEMSMQIGPLPFSLRRLITGTSASQPEYVPYDLPQTLIYARLPSLKRYGTLDWKLPEKLKVLEFCENWYWFREEVDTSKLLRWKIGSCLTHLRFRDGLYNFPVGIQLPETIEYLDVGKDFNQSPSEFLLPSRLKWLNLGSIFDKPVTGWNLPSGLTHLHMSEYFKQPIAGCFLPYTLLVCTLGLRFDHEINGLELPSSLRYLRVCSFYSHKIDGLARGTFVKRGPDSDLPDEIQSLLKDPFSQYLQPGLMNKLK